MVSEPWEVDPLTTVENVRQALREMPPAQAAQILRDLLTDPGNDNMRHQLFEALRLSGWLLPTKADPPEQPTDAEVEAATDNFINRYRPALERLFDR